MRSAIFTFLSSTLLILAACTSEAPSFFGQATPTPAETPTPLPTPVQVFQTTITADGEVILSVPAQNLNFQSAGAAGTIAEVYVTPGQAVKAGDPLARIDDADLRRALDKAEAALALTQAQIESEAAPALAGDITEAQVGLTAAQAELARLQNLPSEEAITQAAADLRLNEIELRRAQEAYDAVAYAEGVGMSPQAAELQKATLNYERAQAIYQEASRPASEAELAAARSKVVQAQNQLDKLVAGLRPEAQAVNKARLIESQLLVEEAQANLAKALFVAPWDGTVVEVQGAPGVSTAEASITLVPDKPLRFATRNFNERNLADVKVGDEATLYLKTYPGQPFPAVIQRIELESSQRDGDTALFTVYLDFNSGDFEVRPGMTGRVEIKVGPGS